jgi:hypothetical protein
LQATEEGSVEGLSVSAPKLQKEKESNVEAASITEDLLLLRPESSAFLKKEGRI